MTDLEQLLADRLETRADRVPVGPAPIEDLVRAAVVRRRRPWVALAAAAAVAVVAGGLAVLLPSSSSDPAPPAPPVTPAPAAEDVRQIGAGLVVVEVPADLTEREATVLVRSGSQRRDVFPTLDFGPIPMTIDGTAATRSPTICRRGRCVVAVEIRVLRAQVVVTSRRGRALAEELVTRIRVRSDPTRVGVGHLSVEVPATWSRNATRCGTPLEDTYVDRTAHRECLVERPTGVESVRVLTVDPGLGVAAEVDGVPALRSEDHCTADQPRTCVAQIWVPSEGVGLEVSSSTGESAVEAIMDTLRLDPGQVAVPAPYRLGDGAPLHVGRYSSLVDEAGLRGELTNVGDGAVVLSVTPEVGTIVPVGSTVRVEFGQAP